MARAFVVLLAFLVIQRCSARAVEETVVSVYTTLPTTPHHQLDVYHQIANNLAERITSPIYRFLGFGKNTTTTTKAPWRNIEILDDPEDISKPDLKPVDNDISITKDVEELSAEALKKIDTKPEKITLFSSYLPSEITNTTDSNDNSTNEVDNIETFGFDDDGIEDDSTYTPKPRDGPIVYILEVLGSLFTLIYEGIAALFTASNTRAN